jgi:hypothetical protein
MAAAGEAPKPIVFTGLRGMGKTALLRRVARDAGTAGGIAIVGEADRTLRFGEVMRRELGEALAASQPLPARLKSAIKRSIAALPKVSYEIPHDAGSIAVSASGVPDAEDEAAGGSLEDTLHTLNEQLHAHGSFLMLGLDEIQESPPADLLAIIRTVHKTAGTDRPILFVGAGLPNSGDLLRSVRTYTERWAYFRLELLSRSDTHEAIDVPARELNVSWERDALDEVYNRTHGYPYFLQEFASASWLHRKGNSITRGDVLAVSEGILRSLDESLYDRQFARATSREAAFILALHRLGSGPHRLEDVAAELGLSTSAGLSSTRTQLSKKDVIYTPTRGFVEFRIPLTNEYIERHFDEIRRRAASE